ncbi:MAG: hypothetical protein AVDCRST_MAG23-335 [uncultured Sphingosinicella sp.]|uniref:Uncharacterized protein n=1 Tax=uncultured Sphingosinicella sp. TaxID=478748 RepID=A0A6J4TI57_9SPHN|nr:hypothetical protein [uncultured Sphingosinicella sp.]CAA9522609.1 MAG: hypothetical protein AVDCRST_MAG23-335 [uncultured Sphingosinicella sp.]
MTPFAPDQYIILALVFVLGLVLGMYLLSGGKWKRRYKDEVRRREELEVEHRRLEKMHAGGVTVDNRHGALPRDHGRTHDRDRDGHPG